MNKKKCRSTLTTDSYKFQKIMTSVKWTTALMKITQPPKLQNFIQNCTALTCQGELSSPKMLMQFSADPGKLCHRLADYFIALNWLLKTSFFFSVGLVLGFSAEDLNSVCKYSVIFWCMHLLPLQLLTTCRPPAATKSIQSKESKYFVIWSITTDPSMK